MCCGDGQCQRCRFIRVFGFSPDRWLRHDEVERLIELAEARK